LRNRGYSLDKDEDELKTKLETLDQGLTDPALSARTEELWSRLLLLKGYADTLRNEMERRGTETQEGLGEEAEAKAKKVRISTNRRRKRTRRLRALDLLTI
jgi:nuclear pore complex protein Nup54